MGYILLGLGVLILALSGALWYQTADLNTTNEEFAAYKATLKAYAEVTTLNDEKREREYAAQATTTDERWKADRAGLVATVTRLQHDIRSSASVITKPTPETASTETICYDWAELDRAQRDSEEESARISQAGAEAITDLNTAIIWANPIWAGQEALETKVGSNPKPAEIEDTKE